MSTSIFRQKIDFHASQRVSPVFLTSSPGVQMTYRDLKDGALALSDRLNLKTMQNNPVLVYLPDHGDQILVASFLIYLQIPALVLPYDFKISNLTELFEAPIAGLITTPRFAQQALAIHSNWTATASFDLAGTSLLYLTPPQMRENSEAFEWALMTSGSTGQPKVVKISGDNLMQRTLGEIELFQLKECDEILNLLPVSHDLGLNQLLTAILTASRVDVFSNRLVVDLSKKLTQVAKLAITGIPSVWEHLLRFSRKTGFECTLNGYITVSGGSMTPTHMSQLVTIFPQARIIKTYGQTETFRTLTQTDQSKLVENSCGRPLSNVEAMLINEAGTPCGPGERGQLVHFGAGSMSGYWLDHTLTETKMFLDQDSSRPGILTGDYFTQASGEFTYVGRQDDMVKISGYRFNLKEIENCLVDSGWIESACVMPLSGASERLPDQYLVAFVLQKENIRCSDLDLKAYCADNLATVKIPRTFVFQEQFPMTASRKIDRQSLLKSYLASHEI